MKKKIPTDSTLIPDIAKNKFKGVIYDVYQWDQEQFDGSNATFEMLRRPDTVQVICTVDDRIIVLKEEQPHHGARLSYPGGRVDEKDQSILAAAKRECLEETGYEFNNWRLVSVWQPHTKIEWFFHLFIAWDVSKHSGTSHDAGEKIIIKQLPFNEVKELVLNNVGYLGEARGVFEKADSIVSLLNLPEFDGKVVDR